ncbi:MAG: hypothetical protein Q8L08_11355 [Candidatus Nanopelagicaceae bacterium]|nr:hypothetical protein [Candidatus Nanopelagicaceae bacterium]
MQIGKPAAGSIGTSGGIPVAVVVDTRNVHGMFRSSLGVAGHATRAGVVQGLARYGLDAVDIAFAVGTRTTDKKPQGALATSQKANQDYAARLLKEGARVLNGMLQVKGNGEVEEKQVDVLCAVEVIRLALDITSQKHDAVAVVLLSIDKDIEPAVIFAREELSVPILTAAATGIDSRQGEWILLTEEVLMDMAGSHGAPRGRERRHLISRFLKNHTTSTTWTAKVMPSKQVIFRNSQGLEATLLDSELGILNPNHNDILTAYPIGIAKSGGFPHLVISQTPRASLPEFRDLNIKARVRTTYANVMSDGKDVRFHTPTGYPREGASALLELVGGGTALRFVGELSLPAGHQHENSIHLVTLVSRTPMGDGVVVMPDGGRGILKIPTQDSTALAGTVFATVRVTTLSRGATLLHAVSTALPK